MKRILGLDLGTNSIGWALVEEAENHGEQSGIVKLGVRVNPLTVDEKNKFEKGEPLSTNAERTQKRGARRNLQRYKLRRAALIEILKENGLITDTTPLTEIGKNTTHQTLALRAKSAREQVSLEDLAKILLLINKKRGYKSSRKAKSEDEGQSIDGMAVAKELYDEDLTPGQYVFQLLSQHKKYIPDFYRSDLQNEFDKIWRFQRQFYADTLTDALYERLQGKNKTQTWAICKEPFQLVGIKIKENGKELKGGDLKKKHYELRSKGLSELLDLELLAIVLQEINNNLNQSSGYLGAISDRSKELYFRKETVGEYLWKQVKEDRHTSLKNQVFYRQDYLDEFEQIWNTQASYHKELTDDLKEEIRDVIIFYQRKLKSQKGLLAFCQFESWEVDKRDKAGNRIINKLTGQPKKQRIGRRVVPKSSPLFQEFKIWQAINNLAFQRKDSVKKRGLGNQDGEGSYILGNVERTLLFEELNLRGKFSEKQVLKVLGLSSKEWKTNYPEGLEGNRTNQALYEVYQSIAEQEGYGFDWARKSANEIKEELKAIFSATGINAAILDFDANVEGEEFDKQPAYALWHLLYATEEDEKITEEDRLLYGNSQVVLKKKLVEKFGFKPDYAKLLSGVALPQDYGHLSSKAIRKIIPYLQEGHNYYEACQLAGYNHSKSLTKEENEARDLVERLELLPKNSMRNPVVEKILNQMINLVNQVVDEYGKPDEIRIELARELKKNAKERGDMTKQINEATRRNEEIKKKITKEFGIPNPTKSDVVRWRLWDELAMNAHKDLFRGKEISPKDLFTGLIEIEHIIPKALRFDDSFSNKTLAFKQVNLQKADRTAIDFITQDYLSDLEDFKSRVEMLYDNGKGSISKAKRNKLLMCQEDLPDGFIERDLRNSQYIAKKAKDILQALVRNPVVATSGTITDRLREDWDLINVMKELNMPKYRALGLTEFEQRLNKQTGELVKHEVIKDWTKRNDHRHHAMDALTVAFTTHSHIQYLNFLNARRDQHHSEYANIMGIEQKITETYEQKNGKGKRKFIPPMEDFRGEAKKHIEAILISIKTKNKVVTKNSNKSRKAGKDKYHIKEQLTPRGQLHKETVYGRSKRLMKKPTKLNKGFTLAQASLIANPLQKELVISHLNKFSNNPDIAFDRKSIKKMPLMYQGAILKEVLCYEEIFTIRKEVSPGLKIEKVIDEKVKAILQKRLAEFGGDAKKAFSDLEQNPIWLNKEKGIAIKRVTITGVSNAEALHHKKDHLGRVVLDEKGHPQAADFVSTGNNHHVAIYEDSEGKLQEKVISFYEAVARINEGLPVIDKAFNKDKGWKFLFTMKQNEMFVFPNDDFDIQHIDFLDQDNARLISKHLFRVQKISTKNYMFTHHLETKAIGSDDLKHRKMLFRHSYYFLQNTESLRSIKKVRIDHLGRIVQVGEY
ncbi:MAG: type II CRISPR RNA-guided endonuclease Cas9 [Bacteroidetes bacterium]|nr:MAG: type II CRISPR RNA-guided endonuclease Cas9 [Bacteroidota bacterium]PIE88312.1 MAG: type II CRISPR RNA-guided endonuclease Cas9 [Bacteroidota bacterium]